MHLLRLLVWDTLFFIVLSVSHFAAATLTDQTAGYIVTLLTLAICGIFLSQIRRIDAATLIVVTIPALYLALAPFLTTLAAVIPVTITLPFEFQLVPSVLLSSDTIYLRYAGALTAGYTLGQKAFL